MAVPNRDEIKRLTVDARIRLIEEIWESICEDPEALPVTDAQRAELDRRLDHDQADATGGTSWNEVRDRLRAKR